MNEWRQTKEVLNGYPALKHKVTHELTSFGEYGYIWESSPTELKILIHNPKAYKFKPKNFPQHNAGDELVFRVSASDMYLWVKRLNIPGVPHLQAPFAAFAFDPTSFSNPLKSLEFKNAL